MLTWPNLRTSHGLPGKDQEAALKESDEVAGENLSGERYSGSKST